MLMCFHIGINSNMSTRIRINIRVRSSTNICSTLSLSVLLEISMNN